MSSKLGLRLEDKNEWERRVALIPTDVAGLVDKGVDIHVERFARRAFDDARYEASGATLANDVRDCDIVLGIKEMPLGYFRNDGAYMFFSHTIKGQSYNMKMLAELVEKRCTLFDYEVVTDDKDRRLIFFGRFAGLAGMIDTLWTLGLRLKALGHETPFLDIEPSHAYEDLEAAKEAVARVGKRIETEGLPSFMAPTVFGFTGYGHVAQGAQEIIELLPHVEVAPGDLASFVEKNGGMTDKVVKVVYREEDLVEHASSPGDFNLQDYYDNGENYRSIFQPHLELLTVIINGIYWDERYPKLGDAEQLKDLFAGDQPRLLAVGDITCDVDGSLACTVRDTEPGDPSYVYNASTREAPSGFDGPGLAVMAVGNLPCELPREASAMFSHALTPYISAMVQADLTQKDFEKVVLPEPIKRSVILWRGEFTPKYEYMQDFLRQGTD